jgi:hypothetical protein
MLSGDADGTNLPRRSHRAKGEALVMFVIEDDIHAEPHGRYATFDEALAELRRLSRIPWGQPPNIAPCASWRRCGREYAIVDDDSRPPWEELRRVYVLNISSRGVTWSNGFQPPTDDKCEP